MLERIEFLPADATGLTPLARAARAGTLDLPGLRVPRSAEELQPPALRDRDQAAHLARWLETRLTALGPHVRALEAARSLAAPDALCVLAPVRPGLLLSPLAGLWNALAALRLAEVLTERWRRPVVAVAWIRADEGEDAAAAEAFLPNRHHELQRVRLAGVGRGAAFPADLPLDPERCRLSAIRAFLEQLYGDHPHLAEALDSSLPAPGESLAGAAARGFLELLGSRGLVVVEPEWLRDEGSQVLAELVACGLREPLERSERELATRGLAEPGRVAREALVLHREGSTRRALRAGGEGFRYDGEPGSRTGAELAAEVVQEPSRWTPGPLLAPLVAERVLPVAAHVGGEEELARQALVAALRASDGGAAPPCVLRPPVTLIDPETARALERSGLGLAQALRPEEEPPRPDPVARPAVLEELAGRIEEAASALLAERARLGEIEPSLPRQLERAVARARGELERVLKKAERVAGDRSGRGRRHARRLATVLLPRGGAQERSLAPLSFLALSGHGWIDELLAEWEPFGVEHLAVFLSAPRAPDRDAMQPTRPSPR